MVAMDIYKPAPPSEKLEMPCHFKDFRETARKFVNKPPPQLPEAGSILLNFKQQYDDLGRFRHSSELSIQNEDYYKRLWVNAINSSLVGTGLWISSGEQASSTVTDVLNEDRSYNASNTAYNHGPKYDGIILSEEIDRGVSRREYGFLEISKTMQRPWEPKYMKDHEKIIYGIVLSLAKDPNERAFRFGFLGLGLLLVSFGVGKLPGGLYGLILLDKVQLPLHYTAPPFESMLALLCLNRRSAMAMCKKAIDSADVSKEQARDGEVCSEISD